MDHSQTINVGNEFGTQLVQDISDSFCEKYLGNLSKESIWYTKPSTELTLDFSTVKTISPSFVEDTLGTLKQHASSDEIFERVKFVNINPVHLTIIKSSMNTD